MPANEDIIRQLYAAAEGDSLDANMFASLFHDDGYFLDEASGQRWVGPDVRQPVTGLASVFPDLHRELLQVYSADDVVVVELRLQGTHDGDWPTPQGVLAATGRRFDVPCCDVFHLRDGKVASFHCYNQLFVWFDQLGGFDRADA